MQNGHWVYTCVCLVLLVMSFNTCSVQLFLFQYLYKYSTLYCCREPAQVLQQQEAQITNAIRLHYHRVMAECFLCILFRLFFVFNKPFLKPYVRLFIFGIFLTSPDIMNGSIQPEQAMLAQKCRNWECPCTEMKNVSDIYSVCVFETEFNPMRSCHLHVLFYS